MTNNFKYYMAVGMISYLVWVLLPESTRSLTLEESGKYVSTLSGYIDLEYFKDEYFGYLEYFKDEYFGYLEYFKGSISEYFKTLK